MINSVGGTFVVIEGGDAVGKHTQAELLNDRLLSNGYQTYLESFPRYNTEMGRCILRHLKKKTALMEWENVGGNQIDWNPAPEDPFAFQAMMLADKYGAAPGLVKALFENKVVVCDRYIQSAVAYAGAEGLNKAWLLQLHSCLPQPDISILIDLDPEESLKRRPKTRDRYEENRTLLKVVRENYLEMWAHPYSPHKWFQVDGRLSPHEIHESIWNAVKHGS